jgi:4a-hydroxytetrahydrobiopterin dehydratase
MIQQERKHQLSEHVPEWAYNNHAIKREFELADFKEAFSFMTQIALACEAADHHPDWSNSYNKVTIKLSTHSTGDVTDKDVALATYIDALYQTRQSQQHKAKV